MNKKIAYVVIYLIPFFSFANPTPEQNFKNYAARVFLRDYVISNTTIDSNAVSILFSSNTPKTPVPFKTLNAQFDTWKCFECQQIFKQITSKIDSLSLVKEMPLDTVIHWILTAVTPKITATLKDLEKDKRLLVVAGQSYFTILSKPPSSGLKISLSDSIIKIQQTFIDSLMNKVGPLQPKLDFFSTDSFNILHLIMFLLILGLIALYFFNIYVRLNHHRDVLGKIYDRHKSEDDSKFSIPPISSQTKNSISRSEYLSLKVSVDKLTSKLEKLEINKTHPSFIDSHNFPPSPPLFPATNPDVFYMSKPTGNYFYSTAKSNTKENTLYKFTVKGNKSEADFEIHTGGAPISEIMSNAESYIKPACEVVGNAPIKVLNILTDQPGKAILEGDKWLITTKAKIRYE